MLETKRGVTCKTFKFCSSMTSATSAPACNASWGGGGIQLELATTARRALELRFHPWDAVVIDYRLPDGNGLDVLSTMRGGVRPYYGPALIMTGCDDKQLANLACALDASFLRKPFDVASLLSFFKTNVFAFWLDGEIAIWRERYHLTEAEAACLRLTIEGLSQNEIASSRGVSVQTVRDQSKALLRKTGDERLSSVALRLVRDRRR